ncbi:uncharacterized mitochondrial protein-like protein [Tanacetum coccineum]
MRSTSPFRTARTGSGFKSRVVQSCCVVLVHWSNISKEDATWESIEEIQRRFPEFNVLATPTKKHLEAIKRVFWYLRGTINMGLWYPKDTAMALTAYADVDHAGCQDTYRSTS